MKANQLMGCVEGAVVLEDNGKVWQLSALIKKALKEFGKQAASAVFVLPQKAPLGAFLLE
jgi:hypothetical protein